MRKMILIIAIISGFTSCYTYWGMMRDISPKFTNKLGIESLNVRNKLQIDGFYRYTDYNGYKYYDPATKQTITVDSINIDFVLFEDGSFVHKIFYKNENIPIEHINTNMDENVKKIKTRGELKWGGEQGIYSIQNDTLTMQIIKSGDIIVAWSFYERRFLILNDTTLQYLSYQNLDNDNTKPRYAKEGEYSLAHFHSANFLPPLNTWFKKKRWAWKNESDWEHYMENLKKKKD